MASSEAAGRMVIPFRAPAGGGVQISIRLPEDILDRLAKQVKRMEWSRSQIIMFVLDAALSELEAAELPEG